MKNLVFVIVLLGFMASSLNFAEYQESDSPYDCGNYRIAFSHDGNDHDEDDIAASAMVLAMVAEAGLKDKFVFMDYSSHIWGDKSGSPAEMRESVHGAAERWGIDPAITFEVRVPAKLEEAKTAFRAAVIEAFDAGAEFYYGVGGPMEVPYQLVENLEQKYRDIVTVISHHGWNDNHQHDGSRQWSDLIKIAGNNIHIDNQNHDYWSSSLENWIWLKNKGGKYEWLYNRNPFSEKFDASDAGILYYIITGRGNKDATKADVQELFNDGPHSCTL